MAYDPTLPLEVVIPFRRDYDRFRLPRYGTGYLAGEFPGGITTLQGVPVAAIVRVLLRTAAGHPGDGALVAQVQSAPDGTWRVDGLYLGFKYDVVARLNGRNDVIVANVSPALG